MMNLAQLMAIQVAKTKQKHELECFVLVVAEFVG